MLFNSWIYAFFLALTCLLYWSLPWRAARQWLLIGAGMAFYAYYYPPHLWVIAGFTILIFVVTVAADGRRPTTRGRLLGGAAALCIGVLAYFKYQGFLRDSLAALGWPDLTAWGTTDVRVPLAVSFFTFEYVHYLIELRRGTIARARFADFLLFIMFFPTLICGPIKRFNDFQPQIGRGRFDPDEISAGLGRIVEGLAKKIIVADTVARWIAPVWADPAAHGWGALWLGTYGYAVQIYFDFAGYSDIAIGSAQLLGYHVPENFDAPYLKSNIAAFWRSWHMSLTSWITDYVYIPLGGNRLGRWRSHLNRLIAMTLCGLWHGAAWHFALWGFYHGVGLGVYRAYQDARRRLQPAWQPSQHPVMRGIATLATFHFVCVGWVLFVADFTTARHVIARLLLLQ
jgi:alginate O-acetyltransferase complex protein AlgI